LSNSKGREGRVGEGEYQQEQQEGVDTGSNGLYNFKEEDFQRRSEKVESPGEGKREKNSWDN
jgi:hypothetical protein